MRGLEPRLDPDGVVLDVAAAGVTFADLLLTRGLYQKVPDLPFTPGLEVAGTVATSPEGSDLMPGERVAAFTGLGGWCERVSVPPNHASRIPDELTFIEGVAMVVNFHTVHYALVERARMRATDTVVVYGAAGAIGSAAVQVASALGARVVAVVVDDAQAAIATQLGAAAVVHHGDELREVGELTAGAGAEIIFDTLGVVGERDTLRMLSAEGRVVVIGFAAGKLPEIAANRLLMRNLDAIGVGWGHMLDPRPDLFRTGAEALARLVAECGLRPAVRGTYPLDGGAEALRAIDERRINGKLVLEVPG